MAGNGGTRQRAGRGDGGEAADSVGGLFRPSMAFEALGLLPGVTPLPNPSPIKGEGLEMHDSGKNINHSCRSTNSNA